MTNTLNNFLKGSFSRIDINFFSFLIILLPIALITGPAVPDIIISITGFYFLIISIIKKLWKYYKNIFVYFFALFCLYGFFRSIFSDFPEESLTNGGSIFYFRYLFFILGFWYLIDQNNKLSKYLLYSILICCLVVILDGFYQYFVGVNFFGNEKWSADRLTGLFGDEPIIGRYVAYLSILAFILIYQVFQVTKLVTILSILLLVVSEIFVFFSGERAPFFYLTFFSFLIVIYIEDFRLYRIIGFILSIVVIFSIINFNPTAKDRMIDTTINQINETKLPFLPYSELHERHYISALKMFRQNPIVGVGTNLFRTLCEKKNFQYKKGSCTNHPHNFYIQLLAEQGIIGFLFLSSFFIFLIILIIKQALNLYINKRGKISFKNFLIVLILFVFWWPLIPHMSFYNNWNNIFLMLPIAYFLKYFYGKKLNF